MSEKVSQALLNLLNEIASTETMNSKVKAAIFVKKSETIMKEKVSYLYNLLQVEASSYGQKPEKQFDRVGTIIDKYRGKLDKAYSELYLQYLNIQKEIGEAKTSQKVSMINYQRVINESEKTSKTYRELKDKIKKQNDAYEEIINKCEKQFENIVDKFQEKINENFFIESNLKIKDENNVFSKIKNAILNFFNGSTRYKESLERYEAKVDNIDIDKIIKELREETIDFVTDILEIKDENLERVV